MSRLDLFPFDFSETIQNGPNIALTSCQTYFGKASWGEWNGFHAATAEVRKRCLVHDLERSGVSLVDMQDLPLLEPRGWKT
jgi:hypothetical protein